MTTPETAAVTIPSATTTPATSPPTSIRTTDGPVPTEPDDSDADLTPPAFETLDVDGVTMYAHWYSVPVDDGPVDAVDWYVVDSAPSTSGVEAPAGAPILFVHGAPECWATWHRQLADLASDRRVIAVDLPGFGVEGDVTMPAGAYVLETVASQLDRLMGLLGVESYELVTHDWGSAIGSVVAVDPTTPIDHFIRMQAPIIDHDISLTPWWDTLSDPVEGPVQVARLQDLEASGVSIPPTDAMDDEEMLAYAPCMTPNRFEAWRRYFAEMSYTDLMEQSPHRAAATEMPVLLLQADGDAGQPLAEFEGAADLYPDARLDVVTDSGHFVQVDQPDQVTAAIRSFLGL